MMQYFSSIYQGLKDQIFLTTKPHFFSVEMLKKYEQNVYDFICSFIYLVLKNILNLN